MTLLTSLQILEDIILRVALQVAIDEYVAFKYFGYKQCKLQPATILGVLSSVDRTFRATIKGSPKLQRAFTGELSASPAVAGTSVLWLLQRALGTKVKPYPAKIVSVRNNVWMRVGFFTAEEIKLARAHMKKVLKGTRKAP